MRNRDKRKARRLKQLTRTLHLTRREARLPDDWQPPQDKRPCAQIERQRMEEWR